MPCMRVDWARTSRDWLNIQTKWQPLCVDITKHRVAVVHSFLIAEIFSFDISSSALMHTTHSITLRRHTHIQIYLLGCVLPNVTNIHTCTHKPQSENLICAQKAKWRLISRLSCSPRDFLTAGFGLTLVWFNPHSRIESKPKKILQIMDMIKCVREAKKKKFCYTTVLFLASRS